MNQKIATLIVIVSIPVAWLLASYWRSWNLYVGLPTNLGGLQLLNEYVSGFVEIPTGQQWAVSDGGHLYEHC